ncbi:MAG: sulfur carrier protein ThiS [Candidatus Dormibacteria bacterium]
MIVVVNGDPLDVPEGTMLSDVLGRLGVTDDRRGIAVALDGDVILRAGWPRTPVADGQRVELLEARAGG